MQLEPGERSLGSFLIAVKKKNKKNLKKSVDTIR